MALPELPATTGRVCFPALSAPGPLPLDPWAGGKRGKQPPSCLRCLWAAPGGRGPGWHNVGRGGGLGPPMLRSHSQDSGWEQRAPHSPARQTSPSSSNH